MMNAGFLLSTLVCGKALCHVTSNCNDSPHDRIPVNFGELWLRCFGVCNRMFNSTCSAVAESATEVHITYRSVRSGQ
ncbi:hypothetical protein PR003_g22902 [Phytophthora rubi]|uniref:Secreted protein n=1 Tax=Phytophthora rubi TaxID=129364 RepID=A0A6A4D3Y6_9STRA|nr:hypothetical protein PR003_g22902 [Phytophthora rubi]